MTPDYYNGKTGMTPFDVIDEFGLDFYEGNVVKFVIRWRKKGGVEDLRKARRYLAELIMRHADEEIAEVVKRHTDVEADKPVDYWPAQPLPGTVPDGEIHPAAYPSAYVHNVPPGETVRVKPGETYEVSATMPTGSMPTLEDGTPDLGTRIEANPACGRPQCRHLRSDHAGAPTFACGWLIYMMNATGGGREVRCHCPMYVPSDVSD